MIFLKSVVSLIVSYLSFFLQELLSLLVIGVFCRFIVICLSVDSFLFTLLQICWTFQIWGWVALENSGEFFAIISLNNVPPLISLFLLDVHYISDLTSLFSFISYLPFHCHTDNILYNFVRSVFHVTNSPSILMARGHGVCLLENITKQRQMSAPI